MDHKDRSTVEDQNPQVMIKLSELETLTGFPLEFIKNELGLSTEVEEISLTKLQTMMSKLVDETFKDKSVLN